MHNIECNTFLAEVSTDMCLIMQHKSVFIAAKGLTSTKLRKVIIC
jgi:hypothetical protein